MIISGDLQIRQVHDLIVLLNDHSGVNERKQFSKQGKLLSLAAHFDIIVTDSRCVVLLVYQ